MSNLLQCFESIEIIWCFCKGIYQRWSPRGRQRTSSRTHFEVLGLGLEASSPWPRSLRSSKIVLSSARGQHYFWTVEILLKTRETSRKICKYFFYFAQLEHRLSQVGLSPQLKFHQWQKCDKKAYCSFSFSFFLAFFVYTSSEQQYWRPRAPGPPKINFCQPI